MSDSSGGQQLLQAKRLIGSNQPISKIRAERILRDLIQSEPQGSSCQRRARDMLAVLQRDKAIDGVAASRETRELQDLWAGIHSLNHGQMIPALENLFNERVGSNPVCDRLREDVIGKIGGWITTAIDTQRLSDQSNAYWRRILQLIRAHPGYDRALSDVETQLDRKRAEETFRSVQGQIDEKLRSWNIEAAWRAREALNPIAHQIVDQVKALDTLINEVSEDRERWRSLAERLHAEDLTDWRQLEIHALNHQMLIEFSPASAVAVPTAQIDQRDQLTTSFDTAVTDFLRPRAVACHSLAEAERFFRDLSVIDFDLGRYLDFSWFDPLKQSEHARLQRIVNAVHTANQLEKVRQGVLTASERSSTAWFSEQLRQREAELSQLVRQWRAIELGAEPDNLPEGNLLKPPEALQRALQTHADDRNTLIRLARSMEGPGPLTSDVYQKVLEEIKPVLSNNQRNQTALALREQALDSLLCIELNAAFESWDIDRFITLCQDPVISEPSALLLSYRRLIDYRDPLHALGRLARQNPFRSVPEGLSWLEQWEEAMSREITAGDAVPLEGVTLPPFVDAQIQACFESRRNSLFKLMDGLLQQAGLAVESFHETAKMLIPWAGEAGLQRYQEKFEQHGWLRHCEASMKQGDWSEATKALRQFKANRGDMREYRRLETQLAFRRAQTGKASEVISLLSEQWYDVVHYCGPQETEAALLHAIDEGWKDFDTEQVDRIIELAGRIPEPERPSEISNWVRWLALDRRLSDAPIGRSTLLELVRMVFLEGGVRINETLREPLQRRVGLWRQSNGMAMFYYAWFYHAARRVEPPLTVISEASDPLDRLAAQTDEVVQRLLNDMRQAQDVELAILRQAERTLDQEQSTWERLSSYFNLLPFTPAKQPQAPSTLSNAHDLVKRVLNCHAALDHLLEADLRDLSEQNRLNQSIASASRIPSEFAWRDQLKTRLEGLNRLTRLRHSFDEYKRYLTILGSAQDLDSKDLFLHMDRFLGCILKAFEATSMCGKAMWKKVSLDCAKDTRDIGKVNVPDYAVSDLDKLSEFIDAMHHNDELKLRGCLVNMEQALAPLISALPDGIPPEKIPVAKDAYVPFFSALPSVPPYSLRGYRLFEREVKKHPANLLMKAKVDQQPEDLPLWIVELINHGAPF